MYNLPATTSINKPLAKKAVFEKFNLRNSEQERFDADISRMVLVARVSSSTVPALAEGSGVKVFYVLQVMLKRKEYNVQNIFLLHKLIKQQIVFALQYENQTQLCIYHTRLLSSGWNPSAETTIPLKGLSIDDAWQNIVAHIGKLDTDAADSIEQQIINREQREKTLRQIDILEKQCRAEKQTRTKYELHQQILDLKKKLDEMI